MTLRRAPVQTRYYIDRCELEHVVEMRDLGITLDAKLTFAPHVSNIVRAANRSLGLLRRSFSYRSSVCRFDKNALVCSYFSHVRSILEYGSVIWTGAADTHTVRIDRVQHKFLIWLLSHSSSGQATSLSYPDLLKHFGIPSLACRRKQHDLMFIRNLFHSRLDSRLLLQSFSLNAPTRSIRTPRLFYEPHPRVNTVKRGLFFRVPQLVNEFLRSVPAADLFADTAGTFKTHVRNFISSF